MRTISIVLLILVVTIVSADESLNEPPITDSDRGHWAFQPLPPTDSADSAERELVPHGD